MTSTFKLAKSGIWLSPVALATLGGCGSPHPSGTFTYNQPATITTKPVQADFISATALMNPVTGDEFGVLVNLGTAGTITDIFKQPVSVAEVNQAEAQEATLSTTATSSKTTTVTVVVPVKVPELVEDYGTAPNPKAKTDPNCSKTIIVDLHTQHIAYHWVNQNVQVPQTTTTVIAAAPVGTIEGEAPGQLIGNESNFTATANGVTGLGLAAGAILSPVGEAVGDALLRPAKFYSNNSSNSAGSSSDSTSTGGATDVSATGGNSSSVASPRVTSASSSNSASQATPYIYTNNNVSNNPQTYNNVSNNPQTYNNNNSAATSAPTGNWSGPCPCTLQLPAPGASGGTPAP